MLRLAQQATVVNFVFNCNIIAQTAQCYNIYNKAPNLSSITKLQELPSRTQGGQIDSRKQPVCVQPQQ